MGDFVAIIPAAGKGSRLGMDVPKALVKPDGVRTLLEMAIKKVSPRVDEVVAIVSPAMIEHPDLPTLDGLTYVVQEYPTGMGDAIFSARDHILRFDNIFIAWADQFGLTEKTIERSIKAHSAAQSLNRMTIPLISVNNPYVEYKIELGKLKNILQQREGDTTGKNGLTDVGCFALTARKTLIEAWERHIKSTPLSAVTKERNFLPFLAELSLNDWVLNVIEAKQEDKLGINSSADFDEARETLK